MHTKKAVSKHTPIEHTLIDSLKGFTYLFRHDSFQHCPHIPVKAHRLLPYLLGCVSLAVIDAGIRRVRILRGHPPERIFDYDGRVHPDAELKEEHPRALMASYEIIVAL